MEPFDATQLATTAPDGWSVKEHSERHVVLSDDEFPAQIDVMYDQYGSKQWYVQLLTRDEQTGLMELHSAEFEREFDRDDIKGTRECVKEFAHDVSSGALDEYREPNNEAQA